MLSNIFLHIAGIAFIYLLVWWGVENDEMQAEAYKEKEMRWWIVEIADGNDGFVSIYANSADEAEQMAFNEGYDVLYAHAE